MISIVIPNYNGENLLKKNLPKVFQAVLFSKNHFEIIVVDDGSKDGSVSFLKKQKVRLIKNSKNLGFSSTVNKGVKEAGGEIIILLNTDVYPEKNFLASLLPYFKDPQVFAVGCLDKSYENGKVVLRGRGLGRWSRGFLVHRRGDVDRDNTLWVSGGSGAFRRNIWNKLGGFNELYNPFYWEDIDISYRALKSGYKVFFEEKSIVNHEHEKGAIMKTYSNFKIKSIAYKNQFIFVWENATDFSLQLVHIVLLPYHFIKALVSMDWAFFIGFAHAFVLLPKIIQSSLRFQKLFIKSDKEIIKNFS